MIPEPEIDLKPMNLEDYCSCLQQIYGLHGVIKRDPKNPKELFYCARSEPTDHERLQWQQEIISKLEVFITDNYRALDELSSNCSHHF